MQTNIEYVIEAAKSHNAPLQTSAMDVLAFTINQGLYHPLQVSHFTFRTDIKLLPLLISLETSEDDRVATDALNLHATLHTKHPTLLNVRYLEFARASYDYQRTITSEVSGHRRGVPLLAGWYSLLSEKRAWRMDFLKAITRAFEFDLMGQEEVCSAVATANLRSIPSLSCILQRTFLYSTISCKKKSCLSSSS